MLQEYIDASVAGKIIAVDWIGIEGMLGESPERLHKCSICEDNKAFPPQVVKENEFSEADISKILKAMPINYMAETYEQGQPHFPIETRFFATTKPSTGPWLHTTE